MLWYQKNHKKLLINKGIKPRTMNKKRYLVKIHIHIFLNYIFNKNINPMKNQAHQIKANKTDI